MNQTRFVRHSLGHLIEALLRSDREVEPLSHSPFVISEASTFSLGDTVIHVDVAPGEARVRRCEEDLREGWHPIVITRGDGMAVVAGLAERWGSREKIDVFEAVQFVSLNLYLRGSFEPDGCRQALDDLIGRYNEIVERYEADPRLRVEWLD